MRAFIVAAGTGGAVLCGAAAAGLASNNHHVLAACALAGWAGCLVVVALFIEAKP